MSPHGYPNRSGYGPPRGGGGFQGRPSGPGRFDGPPRQNLPDRARAPYNFVPLAAQAVFPPGSDRVSHDVPYSDGICGTLELEIKAETPLFIRDTKDRTAFHRLPEGPYAIPGTSLRGMLRSVVEIAGFGKMSRVNDHRYGIRDLHNRELYGNHMADIIRGKPMPLVSAGWLEEVRGQVYDGPEEDGSPKWQIRPCNFAKVEYALLEGLAAQRGRRDFRPGRKQSAPQKYAAWGDDLDLPNAAVTVLLGPDDRGKNGVPRRGSFGKVTGFNGNVRGTLVFTGQPSEYFPNAPKRRGAGNPKHHDFFFHGEAGAPLPVSYRQRCDFSFIHGSGGEQHKLDSDPNPEWKFMLRRMKEGKRVPVFFLLETDGRLRALGLAMMFRLAYRHSVKEAVKHAQEQAFSAAYDLPELIFGRVREGRRDEQTDALRGRVSIETAPAAGSPAPLARVTGVLGSPRASYYPNYLAQGGYPGNQPPRGTDGKPRYQTYQDGNVRVSGWKRYPQRETVVAPPPVPATRQGEVNERVATTFAPLPAGTVFHTRVHIHNLRPFELGALLWAIDFGGRPRCRHGLGMAKACGYGGVTLRVTRADLVPNEPGREELTEPSRLVEAFRSFMEKELENDWESSRPIYELIALATPVPAGQAADLRHMLINHPEYRNEFQQAKQAGLALPLHGSAEGYDRHRRGPGPGGGGGKGTAPSGGADGPAKVGTPAPASMMSKTPTAAEGPDYLSEARKALILGKHLELFRQWIMERGPDEDKRRRAAREVVGDPSGRWRNRNADLWEWLSKKS